MDARGQVERRCICDVSGAECSWTQLGSLRRDCLDHVIAINERQLRSVIRSYVEYCHDDRTHLGLEKDSPRERSIEPREMGEVVAFPRVGGLHHRYSPELQRAA